MPDETEEDGADPAEDVEIADLVDQLDALEATVDAPAERREVERTKAMVQRLSTGVFGERVSKYTTRDVAEAFVGSIVFLTPLLVEDGVYEIAGHFLSAGVYGWPGFLLGNTAFVVVLTGALIYWSDIQRVDVRTYVLGVPVPRRLLGTLVVALGSATLMMTLWGRLGGWSDPAVALARINVVWTAAAIGGALGDLLPGESSGEDISAAIGAEIFGALDRGG